MSAVVTVSVWHYYNLNVALISQLGNMLSFAHQQFPTADAM